MTMARKKGERGWEKLEGETEKVYVVKADVGKPRDVTEMRLT